MILYLSILILCGNLTAAIYWACGIVNEQYHAPTYKLGRLFSFYGQFLSWLYFTISNITIDTTPYDFEKEKIKLYPLGYCFNCFATWLNIVLLMVAAKTYSVFFPIEISTIPQFLGLFVVLVFSAASATSISIISRREIYGD